MFKIDTARLVLRRWRDNDLEPLAAINADPDVMRWIGDGSTRDEVQTRAGLEAMERQKGFASEAAAAFVEFGFRDCGLEQIVSVTQAGNGASERIMEKLGMRLVRESVDPSCGRPIRIYATTRAQHAAAEHASGS
ncbi:GNAT family N-acetyltransferase [Streptomyces shenzhenensis]|uniref:GNAT family N-acetyltransferase n=1 Tax=Streptomyces shenzhenensis TaxID=943815 RepID=UPI00340AB641